MMLKKLIEVNTSERFCLVKRKDKSHCYVFYVAKRLYEISCKDKVERRIVLEGDWLNCTVLWWLNEMIWDQENICTTIKTNFVINKITRSWSWTSGAGRRTCGHHAGLLRRGLRLRSREKTIRNCHRTQSTTSGRRDFIFCPINYFRFRPYSSLIHSGFDQQNSPVFEWLNAVNLLNGLLSKWHLINRFVPNPMVNLLNIQMVSDKQTTLYTFLKVRLIVWPLDHLSSGPEKVCYSDPLYKSQSSLSIMFHLPPKTQN